MTESTLYRRNFLLHLQDRPGYEGQVLLKEPALEQPTRSHLDQLHNEYDIARLLADVPDVRPVLAKEGTESLPVLLLEYIEGHSLGELIRSTSLDLAEKLLLALNMARALGHIHDHQVMHKDVSSGNILVASGKAPGSEYRVFFIDFGLASSLRLESPSRLTADDTLVGTLAYVSPEQTGRMNRQVDYRTDLYSLGICFYELFTGQLPFGDGDALEIIHAHVARQPRPPDEVDVGIPGPVSELILKLLTKNAEDRYQTAEGLQIDIQNCLDRWQREGRIEPFELGVDDFTGRLQIPQRLYGREAEIEQLETTLDRAIAGPAQLLLVAGYSGVGKTSLVKEIQKQVIAREASFVEGKFDQLGRTLPYSAWEQALTQLINSWLAGSEATIARCRETILEAVGDQGKVLADLLPALEAVIGPQPEVPQLGGLESQNRFNYIFGRFISSLATPEHPLVVFLDDLQWIDPASLNLIEALFAAQSSSSLLIIGAYRSNEVGPDHLLSAAQARLGTQSERVTIIPLGDLEIADTNKMLADTVQLPVPECRDLCEILLEKTAGNPFYFRELLYALETETLLRFDRPHRRWVWDDALQHSLPAAGNVVELMSQKIQALPGETQRAVSLAACLGASFEAGTLGTISGTTRADARRALGPAMQSGLIVRSDGQFAFSHDRVQEAGYALIPEEDRPRTHLAIGRSLLASTPEEDLGDELFDIVGHLDAGRALIEAESKRLELAELNLKAGQRAKGVSAFAEAKTYVEIGLDQLGPDAWKTNYELTLSLHNEFGELAGYTGQYDQIAPVADLIHENARSILDQVRIYMAEIEAATTRYDFKTAVDTGLDILVELGVDFPTQPRSADYDRLRDRYFDLLTDRPKDVVAGLPEMTDERALAASEILAAELTATYISRQEIYPIVGFAGAVLTLEYGYTDWSPVFFAATGNVLWLAEELDTPTDDVLGHLLFSRQMHEISLELKEDPVYWRSQTRTLGQICVTGSYCLPIEFLSETAQTMFLSGFETGDLNYGGQGALHCSLYGLVAGMDLDQFRERFSEYFRLLHQFNQPTWATYVSILLEAAVGFQEPLAEPPKLTGSYFDEASYLPAANAADDATGRHILYAVKLQLNYHFDLDSELLECIGESEKFYGGAPGLLTASVARAYSALALLRLYPELRPEIQKQGLHQVDNTLRLFAIWSRSVPSTFQHMYDLILAERARISGGMEKALDHYEQAIQGAQDADFTNDEALANELYARFWAERGNGRFAAPLMREAHSLYRKWGAHAKAEHLAKRYPNWLIGDRIVDDEPAARTTTGKIAGELDLRTVLKASQDIAGELALDSLLAKLMTYVIQSSGAQEGSLVLERDGQWTIEAEAAADGTANSWASRDLAEAESLALSVVHYVARTQETVVLEDACQAGEFVQDPYIRQYRVRSVLCTPLVNQGRTSGILYLQNNLAPDVFSPERVSLLRLLSSQMAISIDNARTHADLERLLESRSKALASAEVQVRTLFEDSPLGIALSNPEGKILSVNKTALTMLHITEDELLQRGALDFYDDPSDRGALLRKVQESGAVQDFGVQLVRQDGSLFHANLNVSKLVLEGNEALLVMVEDVTAQIAAEQETAVLEERARLARELHDEVSQTLVSASLLTDSTVRTAEEGRTVATENLAKLSQLLRGALDEMRTLILELRPASVRERTLGQLIGPLADAARVRSNMKVNLRIEGDRVLPVDVTMHLHRIAQESLRNVINHAEAKAVNVDLVCDADEVSFRIMDDGSGFDVEKIPAGHHGLDIMRERAEEVGAVFEVRSVIGEGTEISVTWS